MDIEPKEITIKEIVNGYADNGESGVIGYGGKLNIRPPYQREFVYKDDKRSAVIETINNNFPLNVMYWAKNEDGTFEVIDGQQRTLSFCQYVHNDFSINNFYFHNLTRDKQEKILNYKVMVYWCEGNDSEKLAWFNIVNIAGEKLTDQELRNATYTGTWLADAKLKFSKTNAPAYLMAKDYVSGRPIRQEILETALKWISNNLIKDYMSEHQHDTNANEIWSYFVDVFDWVKQIFPKYRAVMKGLPWGHLYNEFHRNEYDADKIETAVAALMADSCVNNKKGIYYYILNGDKRHLEVRIFDDKTKISKYEQQGGICPECQAQGKTRIYSFKEMDADHITAWSKGGASTINNCTMLCKFHNRSKGNT
jgi:hypothetical protein